MALQKPAKDAQNLKVNNMNLKVRVMKRPAGAPQLAPPTAEAKDTKRLKAKVTASAEPAAAAAAQEEEDSEDPEEKKE